MKNDVVDNIKLLLKAMEKMNEMLKTHNDVLIEAYKRISRLERECGLE